MTDRAKDRRSPDEIQKDIDRTRSDMDHTVDELQGRLSLGRLVDEIWGRVRESGGVGGRGVGDLTDPMPSTTETRSGSMPEPGRK